MDQEEAMRIANDFLLKTCGEVRRVRDAGLLPYDLFLSGVHAKWMIVYKVLPGEDEEAIDARRRVVDVDDVTGKAKFHLTRRTIIVRRDQ